MNLYRAAALTASCLLLGCSNCREPSTPLIVRPLPVPSSLSQPCQLPEKPIAGDVDYLGGYIIGLLGMYQDCAKLTAGLQENWPK